MDLKFSFQGASPDHSHDGHDHGGAPSGIPLPFTTTAIGSSGGASSLLEVHARLGGTIDEAVVIAEALSGDGVAYATAEVKITAAGSPALARALRSALSRAVAGLEGPLVDAVSALVINLGGDELEALADLTVNEGADLVASAELQRRIGVAAGTLIRIGA